MEERDAEALGDESDEEGDEEEDDDEEETQMLSIAQLAAYLGEDDDEVERVLLLEYCSHRPLLPANTFNRPLLPHR